MACSEGKVSLSTQQPGLGTLHFPDSALQEIRVTLLGAEELRPGSSPGTRAPEMGGTSHKSALPHTGREGGLDWAGRQQYLHHFGFCLFLFHLETAILTLLKYTFTSVSSMASLWTGLQIQLLSSTAEATVEFKLLTYYFVNCVLLAVKTVRPWILFLCSLVQSNIAAVSAVREQWF